MLNRNKFYDSIRESLFKKILPTQLEGMEAILNEWEKRGLEDIRQLAYMLATTYHETAFSMQPVKEWGRGRGRKYGVPDKQTGHIYYGRGFVQLTWKYNYDLLGKRLNINLVLNPDLALELPISTGILFEGMISGIFTNRKLSDYINKNKCDYVNARRIINGTDKAELIAKYALKFENALNVCLST
jgi:predicted chitinase